MDPETFRSLHRYGAILSVLALVLAPLAFAIGGRLEPVSISLAFFGSLCGFSFVGAVLEDVPRYRVLGEELLRGAVWYGGSVFGWALILSASPTVPSTPLTAFGLPLLTALGLSLGMVATRLATGLDLKVHTDGGQLLVAITGAVVGGFVVIYLVVVEGRSPMLAGLYVLATAGGLAFWRRKWRGSEVS